MLNDNGFWTTCDWKSHAYNPSKHLPIADPTSTSQTNYEDRPMSLSGAAAFNHLWPLPTWDPTAWSIVRKILIGLQFQAPNPRISTSLVSVQPSCRATMTIEHPHQILQHLQAPAGVRGHLVTHLRRQTEAPVRQQGATRETTILLVSIPGRALPPDVNSEQSLPHRTKKKIFSTTYAVLASVTHQTQITTILRRLRWLRPQQLRCLLNHLEGRSRRKRLPPPTQKISH